MPDVCGTKKTSVHESEEGCFTKLGILMLRNALKQAASNVAIIE
jgi:hypothetical protein